MSSHYDTVVLADGPAGFWPLSETVGATAIDLSGNARHGRYMPGASPGQPGIGDGETSATFNGAGGYVTIAAASQLQPGSSPWSGECWFKTRSTASQAGGLMSMAGPSSTAYQPHAGRGVFAAFAGGSGVQSGRETAAVVTDGGWHHSAVTWQGGSAPPVFYVDGALRATATASATGAPAVTPSAPLIVGATPFFAGQIAKVAVYRRALSASQVAAHYAAAIAPITATVLIHLDGSVVSTALTLTGGSPPGPLTPPIVS